MIVIAHRIHTVTQCDRICVLRDGRIVEIGRPNDLLRNSQSLFSVLRNGEKQRVAGHADDTIGR